MKLTSWNVVAIEGCITYSSMGDTKKWQTTEAKCLVESSTCEQYNKKSLRLVI